MLPNWQLYLFSAVVMHKNCTKEDKILTTGKFHVVIPVIISTINLN